jgi:hypothetical protein
MKGKESKKIHQMGGFDKKVGATLRNWERGDWSKRRDYDYKGGISDPPRNHVRSSEYNLIIG